MKKEMEKRKYCIKNIFLKHIQEEHTELQCNYCGKTFRNRQDNHLYEACKSICPELTSKDEVENYKEDFVIEKEKQITNMEMEHKGILRKKKHKQKQATVGK